MVEPCTAPSDGAPALQVSFYDIVGDFAVGEDGALYVGRGKNPNFPTDIHKIKERTLLRFAGTGVAGYSGDDGLAREAQIYIVQDITTAPDGSVYIFFYDGVTRHVHPRKSKIIDDQYFIPSTDASEIYIFSASGTHLQTKEALTGSIKHDFGYDAEGRLLSVTDGDGNVTLIERDASGDVTGIVPPTFGSGIDPSLIKTDIVVDGNGYISSVTHPDSAAYDITSTAYGLITAFTDPNNGTSHYDYNEEGNLISVEDAALSQKTLDKSTSSINLSEVTLTSGEGRETTYGTSNIRSGLDYSSTETTVTFPNGLSNQTKTTPSSRQYTTLADGTEVTTMVHKDPVWGMWAPISDQTTTTPGGLEMVTTMSRDASLLDEQDPLSLESLTETTEVNAKASTRSFDGATRQWTYTSPEGRESYAILDCLVPQNSPRDISLRNTGR